MMGDRRVSTMAETYRGICAGEMPWVALGNVTNEWLDYAQDQRERLIGGGNELYCIGLSRYCSRAHGPEPTGNAGRGGAKPQHPGPIEYD